jgi:hypothetical protein
MSAAVADLLDVYAAARGEPTADEPPPGFERGSLPGTIAPTSGVHKGVPMMPDSALAKALLKEKKVAQPIE